MEDRGGANIYLGFQVIGSRKKYSKLKQEAYAGKVLYRLSMTDSKAVTTPMEAPLDNTITDEELIETISYAQAIVSLMYLMIFIRPGIAFAVRRLSQYMTRSTRSLWTCVKGVLRYIHGQSLQIWCSLPTLTAFQFQYGKVSRTGPDAKLIVNRRMAMCSA